MVWLQIADNLDSGTHRVRKHSVMEFFQKADTVDKIRLPDSHHQIDGIKVFFTVKTTGQVGFTINAGIKLPAQGTQKRKTLLAAFAGDIQNFPDQHIYSDIVSKCKQQASGELFVCHVSQPDPAWYAD